MWIGIVVFTFNWYFVVVVSLLYWVYYERIMFAEERFLERKFGQQYLEWASKLPAFIPKFSQFKKSNIPFSLVSVLRREYSGVLATVIGFVFVLLLRNFFEGNKVLVSESWLNVLAITTLVSLVLRTLKRSTSLLDEEGRS
jgi:protein-S-isoprenylcysteine O-methyltransferase Ste14